MSKGGTTSGSTEIPAWLENAAIENINKARDVSQIGYVPYYGPDVAAFSPMQQQSMQSTGNAASAFGLAPQGFDAMAGMPQAQTFAGGLQGYSSAPLYEQSLDKLFANAPAQYNAMNNMFIDPFTGARPQGNYAASPTQVSQMSSGGGGGGSVGGSTGPVGGAFGPDGNNDGEYFGVNSQYNPYKYSTPTEDISGDGVIDYRDMSFGEAGRRDVGFGENLVNFIKSASGIGAIGSAIDYGQGLADGFTPSPFDNGLFSQTSGPSMTPAESMRIVNENADRYERLSNDRGFNPNSLGSIGSGISDEMLRDDTYENFARAVPFNGPQPAMGGLMGYEYGNGQAQAQAQAQARQAADQLAAQQAQARAAADQLAQQQAIQVAIAEKDLADQAAQRMAVDQANQLAHEKAMAAAQANQATVARAAQVARERAARSTVNSGGGGNNNSGGSTYSGGGKAASSGYGGISGGGGK
jgi:hypothetical protein